ncbi:MAG: thioesterase family protein, partial [Planctomycetota bacterium]
MAGIMHFSAFFQYMESAEHELLRSLGMSVLTQFEGEPISFPRVSASCDFASPAHCEDVLQISVAVQRVGEKSVTYSFRFSHLGRLVANGEMTSVCCRVVPGETPQSRPIPNEIAEKLRSYRA